MRSASKSFFHRTARLKDFQRTAPHSLAAAHTTPNQEAECLSHWELFLRCQLFTRRAFSPTFACSCAHSKLGGRMPQPMENINSFFKCRCKLLTRRASNAPPHIRSQLHVLQTGRPNASTLGKGFLRFASRCACRCCVYESRHVGVSASRVSPGRGALIRLPSKAGASRMA